jgi:hypothetical protein
MAVLFTCPGLADPNLAWLPGTTVPIYSRRHQHSAFSYGVKDFVPLMEWFMKAENAVLPAGRLKDYPAFFYGVKDFIPQDWFFSPENPRGVKNVYWVDRNGCFVPVISQAEDITLDKWFSESLNFNPVLRVYKNYAYLFVGHCVIVFPFAVGTQVIHYSQAREVLSRMVPPQVIREGFDINRVHIDFRPDTDRSNPANDPIIK